MIGENKGFKGLKPFMQQAVILKANGSSNTAIAEATQRSVKTVEHWFSIDGVLRQPLIEYSEKAANEALAEARLLVRQALPSAIQTLTELSQTSKNESIRHQAAKTLAQPLIANMARTTSSPAEDPVGHALSNMIKADLALAMGVHE